MRNETHIYPDYGAELAAIREGGITDKLLVRIIHKHRNNAIYNKDLCDRYNALENAVPIFSRQPRFADDVTAINNKINNDFFSEINDFKIGYFAGKPFSYSYSSTGESESVTGGEEAVDAANKAITDFVTRSNMQDKDMSATKYASIAGYAGRLMYIDTDGNERVTILPPYECIVLSATELTEPEFAVRYYLTSDINDKPLWKAEFYDSMTVKYYEGQLNGFTLVGEQPHLFDYCPLQIVPNNDEMIGDAEKVLAAIDNYDRTISDCSNDIEGFANAYMVYKNIQADDKEIEKAQRSGSIRFYGNEDSDVYFLTKDVNDNFVQHHLDRLEDNIYRFSKTPNLNDETFGQATGVALKFKLTALETKCGMFEAKMRNAGQYMFKVLASAWAKRKIVVDPLQCVIEFKRNFPVDILSEAQAAQALITAGLPKEVAFDKALSFIDDIDYVMQLIEAEKESIQPLDGNVDDMNDGNDPGSQSNKNSGDE